MNRPALLSSPRVRAVLTVGVVTSAALLATSPGSQARTLRPSAATSGVNSRLLHVAVAPRSTQAWTLASNYDATSGTNHNRVLRFRHGTWRSVTLKEIPRTATLRGVAAGSTKRIWFTADLYNPSTTSYTPYLGASTGGAFTNVHLPGFSKGTMFGIAASNGKNAWTAGSVDFTSNVVFHWNGHKWKQVTLPSSGADAMGIAAIATSGAKNTWLAGGSGSMSSQHWNGQTWTEFPVPANIQITALATTSKHTWAAGYDNSVVPARPAVLRWNGSAWKQLAVPHRAGPGLLNGLTVLGSTAYAVGHRTVDADFDTEPIALRIHGKTVKVRHPLAVGNSSTLDDIAESSKLTIAVGDYETAGYCKSPFHSLAERLAGGTWKRLKIPAALVPASKTGPVACG
jgi:hypothetical protein